MLLRDLKQKEVIWDRVNKSEWCLDLRWGKFQLLTEMVNDIDQEIWDRLNDTDYESWNKVNEWPRDRVKDIE